MKVGIAGSCLLVAALAACGSGNDDVLTDEKIRASESAEVMPDVDLNSGLEAPAEAPPAIPPDLNEMANQVENEVMPVPTGPRSSIPAAFHGRWGAGEDGCTGASDEWVEVTPNQLSFEDLSGRLLRVDGDYPERFIAVFGYDDGASRWTERDQLVLTGSSNVLVLATKDGRFTYQRCR